MSTKEPRLTLSKRTILVVEDKEAVRDVAVQMLKGAGYIVIEAADGKSGFHTFMKHPEIDLVFTDVIMPGGFSGIEMAKDILAQRPRTLILLATGYEEKAKVLQQHAAQSANIVIVSKPYDVDKIPTLIEAMLARVGI